MKEILRNVLAALAGAFTGIVLISLSQIFAARIYPMPEGIDRTDRVAMAEFVNSLPATAMLLVLLGYFVGTTAAAWIAGRLSARGHYRQAMMVGGLFLVASLMNLTSFSHPAWFWVANLVAVIGGTWLAVKLLPRAPDPAA